MTNSSCPLSRLVVFAIENDRTVSVSGDGDVHVLAGEELDLVRLDQPQDQVPHVVGDRVLGHHLRHALLDRQAGADHLLVVVQQLDRDVLVGVRPAQQRVALLELVVGQRERRVPVVLDVLALEDERLAGGALAFLAAVHEHDSLLGGGAQDVLVLVDLDLDADRLEAHDMLVGHDHLTTQAAPTCRAGGTRRRSGPRWAGLAGLLRPASDGRRQASAGAGRPAGPCLM